MCACARVAFPAFHACACMSCRATDGEAIGEFLVLVELILSPGSLEFTGTAAMAIDVQKLRKVCFAVLPTPSA